MNAGDDSRPASARADWAWLSMPVVAIVAAYAVVLTGGFVWDDYYLVVNSPLINQRLPWFEHFMLPFSDNPLIEARLFYRPLTTLSYYLDHRLWDGWAGGFHLTNVVLHVGFVILLLVLCRRAGASRPVASLLATAFALFPRLSESVAWVSGRTDVAAGIFVLGALLLYRPGQGAWARRSLAGVILLLGLLCKEVALAGAAALILRAWLESRRPRTLRRLTVEILPIAAAGLAYGLLRLPAMWHAHDDMVLVQRRPAAVLVLALDALARYAWMVVDPFQPRIQIGESDDPSLLLAAAGLVLLVGAVVAAWRWRARLLTQQWVALGLGATSMALVLHVIPLNVNVIAADRFLYLPVAALAVGLARPIERLWQSHRSKVVLGAALLVVGFAVTTALRVQTWASEVVLWREAVAQSTPAQPLARIELGSVLMRRGRFSEALGYLGEVPESKGTLTAVNLATCLDKLGHRAEAIRTIEALLRLEPRRISARINLMLLYARDRQFASARAEGERMVRDFPYRIDIPPLVAKVDQAMSDLAALPAESQDEPIERKARRATLYDQLGALPEAQSLWRAIALDSTAGPELRLRGASYLALFGYPEVARQMLDQITNEPFVAGHMRGLRAILESRFDDG
jgi:protein O-mannosyl-transferase